MVRASLDLVHIRCSALIFHILATSDLQYGVFDVQACQVYTGHSPSFQGWYLLPLSIWANLTGDPSLTGL